jgi:hypothetical protein
MVCGDSAPGSAAFTLATAFQVVEASYIRALSSALGSWDSSSRLPPLHPSQALHEARAMVALLVRYPNRGNSHAWMALDGASGAVAAEDILSAVCGATGLPRTVLRVMHKGREVREGATLVVEGSADVVKVETRGGLLGGKGGFGAMLRSMGKAAGQKKTVDFGACRDLYGRRLRHVNDEIKLKKWLEAKEQEEQDRGMCRRPLLEFSRVGS